MSLQRKWYGEQIKKNVQRAMAKGLFVAGEVLLDEANTQVPYMDHILEASGESNTDGKQCIVSYETPYAERLHENPRDEDKPFNFMHGRKSHWLSDAITEQEPVLIEIMARAARGELGG